jgi:hypothetical protein
MNFKKAKTICPVLFIYSLCITLSPWDCRRRRYTVHLTDLEKTVVYALTHEVAQHREKELDTNFSLKRKFR